jgi:biopolymer transport protein ExbD
MPSFYEESHFWRNTNCGISAFSRLSFKMLMTDIVPAASGGRRRAGVGPAKKLSVRVDMTPMVDLGFLLIAFFIMTTQLKKPAAVHLNMPKEGPETLLGDSAALTVLLAKNDVVYYYNGNWKNASAKGEIFKTNFSVKDGLGEVIRQKQRRLDQTNSKEHRNALMLLIKADKEASYQNVIDALDETMINLVKKYAVLKAEPEELEWITQHDQ